MPPFQKSASSDQPNVCVPDCPQPRPTAYPHLFFCVVRSLGATWRWWRQWHSAQRRAPVGHWLRVYCGQSKHPEPPAVPLQFPISQLRLLSPHQPPSVPSTPRPSSTFAPPVPSTSRPGSIATTGTAWSSHDSSSSLLRNAGLQQQRNCPPPPRPLPHPPPSPPPPETSFMTSVPTISEQPMANPWVRATPAAQPLAIIHLTPHNTPRPHRKTMSLIKSARSLCPARAASRRCLAASPTTRQPLPASWRRAR